MFEVTVYITDMFTDAHAIVCWPNDMQDDIAYCAVFDKVSGNVTTEVID
jgi:hypothetical protein